MPPELEDFEVRTIQPEDNKALASVIRNTLAEFDAHKPGTVYFDTTTDKLSEVFQTPNSVYFVVLKGEKIVGGGGIYPTGALPKDTCELVKMYLLPEARGKGIGKMLIERCLRFAAEAGYKKVYLETMPELKKALSVYEKMGFEYLDKPMGNSGHFGCDLWMIKSIR